MLPHFLPILCIGISAPTTSYPELPAIPPVYGSMVAPAAAEVVVAAVPVVQPFKLSQVKITKTTFFGKSQTENTQYLQFLDVDRLLYNFRLVAGLQPWKTGAIVPYGGWIGNAS